MLVVLGPGTVVALACTTLILAAGTRLVKNWMVVANSNLGTVGTVVPVVATCYLGLLVLMLMVMVVLLVGKNGRKGSVEGRCVNDQWAEVVDWGRRGCLYNCIGRSPSPLGWAVVDPLRVDGWGWVDLRWDDWVGWLVRLLLLVTDRHHRVTRQYVRIVHLLRVAAVAVVRHAVRVQTVRVVRVGVPVLHPQLSDNQFDPKQCDLSSRLLDTTDQKSKWGSGADTGESLQG